MNMLMQLPYASGSPDKKVFLKIINHFLAAGLDVNQQDDKGNTALHHAVENFDALMTYTLLLDPKTNRNIKNNKGQTPLDRALYHAKVAENNRSTYPAMNQIVQLLQN